MQHRSSTFRPWAAVAALAGALAIAGAAPAAAQKGRGAGPDETFGTYDVRYEEVSSNCTTTSIAMSRGTLEVSKRKAQLVVNIQRFPLMFGTPAKRGKVRAASKVARSSIEGVDGKFSVAGKVEEGLIQLVFVAEYYVKGKPLCSQTWNVSGQKL
jgi:hypothetical protein